jgi:hypothetical protein
MQRLTSVPEGFHIDLPPAELEFLQQIVPMLEGVGGETSDPAAVRLNPRVFIDDDAELEFTMMTRTDLDDARSHDRAVFVESLDRAGTGAVESAAHGESLVRVLNEARLTLAARWGVMESEDDWQRAGIPHHRKALLDYLGMLQHELVQVLALAMAGDR